jgi:hypothetical protein
MALAKTRYQLATRLLALRGRPKSQQYGRAGQRCLTACASFSPSIDPGILTSVNTTRMSRRVSRITKASSALAASTTSYPASVIISAACMRIRNSSSTTSTTGRSVRELAIARGNVTGGRIVAPEPWLLGANGGGRGRTKVLVPSREPCRLGLAGRNTVPLSAKGLGLLGVWRPERAVRRCFRSKGVSACDVIRQTFLKLRGAR